MRIVYTATDITNNSNINLISSTNISEVYVTAMNHVGLLPHSDNPLLSEVEKTFSRKLNASYMIEGNGKTVKLSKANV